MELDTLTYLKSLSEVISAIVGLLTALGAGYLALRTGGQRVNVAAIIDASKLNQQDKQAVRSALTSCRRLVLTLLAVIVLMSAALLGWYFVPSPDQRVLSKYLAKHDPAVFSHSRNGLYDIARVLPDRASLVGETDLRVTLDETNESFDLLAVHGMSVLEEFKSNVTEALKHGVDFRVVVMDAGPDNTRNFETMAQAMDMDATMLRNNIAACVKAVKETQVKIANDKTTYPGSTEIRYLNEPVFFSIWIRDRRNRDSAVANFSVRYFHDHAANAVAYRLSNKACPRLMNKLVSQFEEIWKRAKP